MRKRASSDLQPRAKYCRTCIARRVTCIHGFSAASGGVGKFDPTVAPIVRAVRARERKRPGGKVKSVVASKTVERCASSPSRQRIVDRRRRFRQQKQGVEIADLDGGAADAHFVRHQRCKRARQHFGRHAEAGGEDLFLEGQVEAIARAGFRVAGDQPVGEPLQARAELLVLKLLDHAAIGEGQLDGERARERRILAERFAHGLGRQQQHARRRQRARRFQVEPIEDDGGDDEAVAGPQHGDGRLPIAVGRKDLDLPLDHDVKEIGGIALVDQLHVRGKALQERRPQHRFDVLRRDLREQRQLAHLLDVFRAHRRSPGPDERFNTCLLYTSRCV